MYETGSSDSSLAAQSHRIQVNLPLTVNGNTFTLSWSNYANGSGFLCTGTFTATLNPDQTLNYEIHDTQVGSYATITYSSKGKNIPLSTSWSGKTWQAPYYGYVYQFDMKEQFDTFYIAAHGVYPDPYVGEKKIWISFSTY